MEVLHYKRLINLCSSQASIKKIKCSSQVRVTKQQLKKRGKKKSKLLNTQRGTYLAKVSVIIYRNNLFFTKELSSNFPLSRATINSI